MSAPFRRSTKLSRDLRRAQLSVYCAPIVERERRQIWCCPQCKSSDIQRTAWVHMNTDEIQPGEGPLDDVWCNACQTHNDGCDQRDATDDEVT